MSRHDISGILVKYAHAKQAQEGLRAVPASPPRVGMSAGPGEFNVSEEPVPGSENSWAQLAGGAGGLFTGRGLGQGIQRARANAALGRNWVTGAPMRAAFAQGDPDSAPAPAPKQQLTPAEVNGRINFLQRFLDRATNSATSGGRAGAAPDLSPLSISASSVSDSAPPRPIADAIPFPDTSAPRGFEIDEMDSWRFYQNSGPGLLAAKVTGGPAAVVGANAVESAARFRGGPAGNAAAFNLMGQPDGDSNVTMAARDRQGRSSGHDLVAGDDASRAARSFVEHMRNRDVGTVDVTAGGRSMRFNPDAPAGGPFLGRPSNQLLPRSGRGRALNWVLNYGAPIVGAVAGAGVGGGLTRDNRLQIGQ